MIPDFVRPEYIVVTLVMFALVLAVYIAQAIFLSKFHKLVYGKGTALGWIPVCNTYLLGKLVVNKLVGWIMVVAFFLTGTFTVTVNDAQSTYSILPENIRSIYTNIYSTVIFVLFIVAIVKYVKLKKAKKNEQAQNSNPSSGSDVSLGNNVASQGGGINQADMSMQPMSTPSVGMTASSVGTAGMEPSSVNVSPVVGVNPQNMNAVSQPEVVSPSVNAVPPVMEPSSVNSSPAVGVNPQNMNAVPQPEVVSPSVNAVPPVMEPSSVNVSPVVGVNPQNTNVAPQSEVVSPSVNAVPPVMEPSNVNVSPAVGVSPQNTNVSSAPVEPSSMDMSKSVIDVFQFANPEASSSTNNSATFSGESVESLQTDDTIK